MTLFIITFVVLFLTFNTNLGLNLSLTDQSIPTQLKINDSLINVEVANTQESRTQGLGGRESLASNSGMLFEFEKSGKYGFWMKGMLFPLDFIWINGNKVVDLLPNVAPPSPNQDPSTLPIFEPVVEVDKVLEVNSGFIMDHNIKVGDEVTLIQN